jgi:hypothetical protein
MEKRSLLERLASNQLLALTFVLAAAGAGFFGLRMERHSGADASETLLLQRTIEKLQNQVNDQKATIAKASATPAGNCPSPEAWEKLVSNVDELLRDNAKRKGKAK